MWPMLDVLVTPVAYVLTNLLQILKQVKSEQVVSRVAFEALDEGILVVFSQLDVSIKNPLVGHH